VLVWSPLELSSPALLDVTPLAPPVLRPVVDRRVLVSPVPVPDVLALDADVVALLLDTTPAPPPPPEHGSRRADETTSAPKNESDDIPMATIVVSSPSRVPPGRSRG
jgi:hypothetical protein